MCQLPQASSVLNQGLSLSLTHSVCVCVCVEGGWVVADGNIFIHLQEVMYKKLLYAINEGQGSFDLS